MSHLSKLPVVLQVQGKFFRGFATRTTRTNLLLVHFPPRTVQVELNAEPCKAFLHIGNGTLETHNDSALECRIKVLKMFHEKPHKLGALLIEVSERCWWKTRMPKIGTKHFLTQRGTFDDFLMAYSEGKLAKPMNMPVW
ncbi:MAG TPA: hypothetical protein V6C76_11660 [Drouetiella sp.]